MSVYEDDDMQVRVRPYSIRELKELLHDNWPTIHRLARRIVRYGPLTAHLYQSAIAHELCLGHRDSPVVAQVLAEHLDGGGHVDVASLKADCDAACAGGSSNLPARRPPFAIKGDHLWSMSKHKQGLESKKEAFRAAMMKAGNGQATVTRKGFCKALNSVERYGVSDREADDLFTVLDPKKTGAINVNEFCDRFTFDFLKPKSMRNTLGVSGSDGKSTAFEWPTSVTAPIPSKLSGPMRVQSARAHRSSSPDRASASGSPRHHRQPPKTTRAAALRKEAGTAMRATVEDPAAYFGLPRLPGQRLASASPRGRAAAAAAADAALAASDVSVPRPPKSGRLNLDVVADPQLLGNVPRAPAAEKPAARRPMTGVARPSAARIPAE